MPRAHGLLVASMMVLAVLFANPLSAQQSQETPDAPIPAQILSAKKIFIANAGAEFNHTRGENPFEGGPNRTYNQFYAAMKAWGRYDFVSAPADADLVFEIGLRDSSDPSLIARFSLRILDPKTHTTMWTLIRYIEPAGWAKNREKNFDLAMTGLVSDLKVLVTPPPAAVKK